MLPKTNNNIGGKVGRAAFGTGDSRFAARAGDFRAIGGCLAIIALAGCTLAFSASDLWPSLFMQ